MNNRWMSPVMVYYRANLLHLRHTRPRLHLRFYAKWGHFIGPLYNVIVRLSRWWDESCRQPLRKITRDTRVKTFYLSLLVNDTGSTNFYRRRPDLTRTHYCNILEDKILASIFIRLSRFLEDVSLFPDTFCLRRFNMNSNRTRTCLKTTLIFCIMATIVRMKLLHEALLSSTEIVK
jgi:hypothetical protein